MALSGHIRSAAEEPENPCMHAYSWVGSGCAAAAAVNAAIAAAVYAARLGSDGADGCALSDRRPLSQTPVALEVISGKVGAKSHRRKAVGLAK